MHTCSTSNLPRTPDSDPLAHKDRFIFVDTQWSTRMATAENDDRFRNGSQTMRHS